MTRASPAVVAFGVVGVGVGVVLLAVAGGGSPASGIQRVAQTAASWADRVIARVSRHEGRHDSLNLNLDGAGLSFGILQWAQKPGNLGVLLAEMQRTDPLRFLRTFGPAWPELLAVTGRGSLEPVAGAVLWHEPWVSRFRAAGRDPVFVQVQDQLAKRGEHFRGALQAASVLGVWTERALALFFDTAVQQGPGFATRLAERVRDELVGAGRARVGYAELLTRYAELAPTQYRRTEPPTAPYPASHIDWRRTGDEWHAWAGSFDLYETIRKRRTAILRDRELTDRWLTGGVV